MQTPRHLIGGLRLELRVQFTHHMDAIHHIIQHHLFNPANFEIRISCKTITVPESSGMPHNCSTQPGKFSEWNHEAQRSQRANSMRGGDTRRLNSCLVTGMRDTDPMPHSEFIGGWTRILHRPCRIIILPSITVNLEDNFHLGLLIWVCIPRVSQ